MLPGGMYSGQMPRMLHPAMMAGFMPHGIMGPTGMIPMGYPGGVMPVPYGGSVESAGSVPSVRMDGAMPSGAPAPGSQNIKNLRKAAAGTGAEMLQSAALGAAPAKDAATPAVKAEGGAPQPALVGRSEEEVPVQQVPVASAGVTTAANGFVMEEGGSVSKEEQDQAAVVRIESCNV